MILRLCGKLAKKIDCYPEERLPLDLNPYADWSCRLFTAERVQYILVTNTVSLYSIVMYGRGITDCDSFTKRVLDQFRCSFCADGLELLLHRHVMRGMVDIRMSQVLNRSVTGSMNDLACHAKRVIENRGATIYEAQGYLRLLPMGALRYGIPRKVFVSMEPAHTTEEDGRGDPVDRRGEWNGQPDA